MPFLMFRRPDFRGRFVSLVVCLMFLVGMLAVPRTTQAQVLYGSVTGNVTDPSGAVLPGARVVALNVATGVAREGMTDSTGLYRFPELLPGIYRVTVSAANFNAVVTENVSVTANTVRRVDAQLKLAQVSQQVTVEASAVALQTDRTDVVAHLEASQLANLPLTSSAGRSFQSLYRIIPGFGVATERNSGAGNPQRSMTTNVNGGSSQGNVTRIDGALDTYIWLPANVAYVPPADSIETVSIVTNSYDAEQGMSGGSAAVNLVTKSGTNQFHGSAYEYHNDHKLRALNIFTPWAAQRRGNQRIS